MEKVHKYKKKNTNTKKYPNAKTRIAPSHSLSESKLKATTWKKYATGYSLTIRQPNYLNTNTFRNTNTIENINLKVTPWKSTQIVNHPLPNKQTAQKAAKRPTSLPINFCKDKLTRIGKLISSQLALSQIIEVNAHSTVSIIQQLTVLKTQLSPGHFLSELAQALECVKKENGDNDKALEVINSESWRPGDRVSASFFFIFRKKLGKFAKSSAYLQIL